MNLSKLRIFFIVLLIFINVLFVKMYFDSVRDKTTISEETISDTVSVLNKKGVEVDLSVIDRNKPKNNIIGYKSVMFTVDNSNSNKADFVNSASLNSYYSKKGFKSKNLQFDCFAIPDGNAISVNYDGQRLAYATFNGACEFKYTFKEAKNAFDAGYINNTEFEGNSISNKHKKLIEEFLSGFSSKSVSKHDFVVAASKNEEYGKVYLIRQLYSKLEIDGCLMVVCIEDDTVVSAYGNWYFNGFEEKYSETQIDAVNILFNDKVLSSKKILSQKQIYVSFVVDGGNILFVPAWSIDLLTEQGKTNVVYDAVTGKLYKYNSDKVD